MAKDKKQPRPKAQTPKGFRDYFGPEVTERTEMLRAFERDLDGLHHLGTQVEAHDTSVSA